MGAHKPLYSGEHHIRASTQIIKKMFLPRENTGGAYHVLRRQRLTKCFSFSEARLCGRLHLHSGLLRHIRGGELHPRPLPAGRSGLRHSRNHRLSQRNQDKGHLQAADADCQVPLLRLRCGGRDASGV